MTALSMRWIRRGAIAAGTAAALFIIVLTHSVLYVSPVGSDANPGTKNLPLRHVSEAYRRIPIGGTIYLLPGTYRETVDLSFRTGFHTGITIRGITAGNRKAVITGAEPSTKTSWAKCSRETCPDIGQPALDHVYAAKWSESHNPTNITQLLENGVTAELTLARAPDRLPGYTAQNWWTADADNRSPYALTDTKNDPGSQAGNLTTLPDLTGATATIRDGNMRCNAFLYERKITKGSQPQGTIRFSQPVGAVTYGLQENGIGAHTAYYVSDSPALLSSPGEWYYDASHQRIFVWPLEDKNPGSPGMEIGVRPTGIRINAPHITVANVTVTQTNDYFENSVTDTGAIVIGTTGHTKFTDISLSEIHIRDTGNGISIRPPESSSVTGLTLSRIQIAGTSKSAVTLTAASTVPSNIRKVTLSHLTVSKAGQRYPRPSIAITRVSSVYLRDNHLFDNAGYGIHITGYENNKTPLSDILIADNRIERSCMGIASCAALKFFGGHFVQTFVYQNTLTDTAALPDCDNNASGTGLFISNASGITARKNRIAGNSQSGVVVYPRQFLTTDNSFIGNTIEDSPYGMTFTSAQGEADNDPAVFDSRHARTVILNNTFLHTEVGLDMDPADPGSVTIESNTFRDVKTELTYQTVVFPHVSDATRRFPSWK